MARITLGQAAAWCGGTVDPKYKDVTFFGAGNDTRTLQPGQLFVALQGARDGHDFVSAAFDKGAAAVLCSRPVGDYPAILVEDTRIALGDIARNERQRLGVKVVGITGSVGKSTTKEMVAAVLQTTYRVGKTPVNHNNDIGMPMAILSMQEDTQVAVLEMGMNHFREMAYLSSIAMPDVAVIINIGTMHIEHLGSVEGILQAKLEILEGMASDGKIILNGDDTMLFNQHKKLQQKVSYFGTHDPGFRVVGKEITQGNEMLRFRVRTADSEFPVELALEGSHYVSDALAAVTVGLEMGVSEDKIRQSLASFRNMEGRQEIFTAGEYTIIKDCYNAGPESMEAALNVLANRPGRHVAVLGDMLELGPCTQAEHYKLGRLTAEKADVLLAYGPDSVRTLKGALTGGMSASKAKAFEDREALVAALKQMARPGDVILFKGSRGMHMELALEKFLERNNTEENP